MNKTQKPTNETSEEEEDDLAGLPPFVSSWNQLYALVILELAVLIGLFYWFTKAFE